jgi:hypothetical protein
MSNGISPWPPSWPPASPGQLASPQQLASPGQLASGYPPPFPAWPPSSGGYPITAPELGPITNPYPYGSTQTGNISTSPPAPAHPYKSTFYPQAMPKGANGQNQGGTYQLPPMTKPWEVGPIKASPSISAGSPPYIMGPGPQGVPPY